MRCNQLPRRYRCGSSETGPLISSENATQTDPPGRRYATTGTSVVEWIAAGFGAVAFLSMLGFLAYEGSREVEGSPKVVFTTLTPERQGQSFLLKFEATNAGEMTATDLTVRATLSDGLKEVEVREMTIDYLPKQSSRSGGFYFLRNPADYNLTLTAASYLDP